MRTALFANGEIDDYGLIANQVGTFQTIVAVDGGLKHCLALELIPHIIIGDMDSSNKEMCECFPSVKIVSHPQDKDESDLELAIDYCNFEISPHVTIFGGTGGYTDHTISNLMLLRRYYEEDIRFATDNEILFALKPGHQTIECPEGFSTISILPLFGEATIANTKGLKWEIENTKVDYSFFSLSNVCSEKYFEVTVEKGFLACSLTNR